MKILIIGLGSMGKRRIRNLLALGYTQLSGVDTRADRRQEAKERYSISTFPSLEDALKASTYDLWVISTPPDLHMTYAYQAFEKKISVFIEASVTDRDKILALHVLAQEQKVMMLPSMTMAYFPGPKQVKTWLKEGKIGSVLSVQYHSGEYLPDWHPWENIQDFYVSKRETGGCREIVPFELAWLSELLGSPKVVSCVKGKYSAIQADIDDYYHAVLRYGQVICTLTVDVMCRPKAVRELRVVGDCGLLEWSSDRGVVRYCSVSHPQWHEVSLSIGTVELGYSNPEEPYIQEMRDVINAVVFKDASLFPNSLQKDGDILQTLLEMEAVA